MYICVGNIESARCVRISVSQVEDPGFFDTVAHISHSNNKYKKPF